MKHATPAQVRKVFLKACYSHTKSLPLVRECKEIFDNKNKPNIDERLVLR